MVAAAKSNGTRQSFASDFFLTRLKILMYSPQIQRFAFDLLLAAEKAILIINGYAAPDEKKTNASASLAGPVRNGYVSPWQQQIQILALHVL